MPSRRQIRQTAIQFLYCSDVEGGGDPAALRDPFWQFVTESDRRAMMLAIRRTIQHLNLGREQRRAEFSERLPAALATLKANPELEEHASQLRRVSELEDEWDRVIVELARSTGDDEGDALVARLTPLIDRLFLVNRELIYSRQQLTRVLLDFPNLRSQIEPILGSIKRLDRISARLKMVETPEDFPEHAEFARIRQSRAELRELREQVDRLVDRVLAKKDAIDRMLESIIDNYAPERVDPIDRAILRLGTLEILFDDDVPAAVAMNEAIELARQFGTTDSPRFVNGILDRIARG
ncbi:N utilization substance protein B [Haloferula luteola]|uniref:Transcription antitermination protein NusB n=1 Tax=Haloferula luteola TaxID=595692 RepID=A0A840UYZ0_9BACT|nr:transcription antitermination factor NusB [Haloferula luteola]MBB5350046.1 N utilization substance protein B [Haloferula luteola]